MRKFIKVNKRRFVLLAMIVMMLLAMAGLTGCASSSAVSLTVGEGFVEPVGFYDSTPVFSWKLPDDVVRQTAYQIKVTKAGVSLWDSGWVESEQSVLVPYGGQPFTSRDRAEWCVRFRDENGTESDWSNPAHFELGLLSNADWKAQWIRPQAGADLKKEPVCWLRRSFRIEGQVECARLYVTARGYYELQLNGTPVNHDHFANGWTTYKDRIDTLTYDVTHQLRSGDNRLQAALGTGWYAGRLNFVTWQPKPAELLLQLEITYTDGTTDTIVSDENWEGTWQGPIVSSSIYDGEVYDAGKQVSGWGPVAVNAELGSARLTPKPFAPVREKQVLPVKEITEPAKGRYVFDLGQNMVGWARLKMPVGKDQTITIRFAELLKDDGTLYTANYRGAKSTDAYTAAESGTIDWEPHFTFHGFRYVELSGLPADTKPQKDWVEGVVFHSDMKTTGSFESSSAMLNQLQSNITWGWRGNSLDIPTDCPQRDERMGWTGDAQVFCATAMFNTDSHAFWKSWLETMRGDQARNGSIPDVIPFMMQSRNSPGWMDAATIIPWTVYVRSGDTSVLSDNLEMMEKLVGFYRSKAKAGLIPDISAYGDWLQPYAKRNEGDTPAPLLATAYYAYSAQILADSAAVLGRKEEANRYAEEAASVKAAFTKQYFDSSAKIQNAPETQTAYVLSLAFDLLPDNLREKAAEHLVRLVHDADDHLRTGFLGTPYIVDVLDRARYSELAAKLLFTESYPSWFFSIEQGATTLWERWNSYSRKDGFGDAGMNSFNHYAYGAIGQWMYERIAGIAPDPVNPGYKHILIRPLIVPQLDWARAVLQTPYGEVSSGWKKKNGKIEMNIVVPPNTTATIEFPNGQKSQEVAAGTYYYSIEQN